MVRFPGSVWHPERSSKLICGRRCGCGSCGASRGAFCGDFLGVIVISVVIVILAVTATSSGSRSSVIFQTEVLQEGQGVFPIVRYSLQPKTGGGGGSRHGSCGGQTSPPTSCLVLEGMSVTIGESRCRFQLVFVSRRERLPSHGDLVDARCGLSDDVWSV